MMEGRGEKKKEEIMRKETWEETEEEIIVFFLSGKQNEKGMKGGREILDLSRGGASNTKANCRNDKEATAPVEISGCGVEAGKEKERKDWRKAAGKKGGRNELWRKKERRKAGGME